MQFKDIIGQDEAKQRLLQGVKNGRIPHAQLFAGPEGSGNLALALAFMQYLSCTDTTDTDSCGVCATCRKMSAMVHPDVHYTFPFPSSAGDSCSELYEPFRKYVKENPYLNYESWMKHLEAENKQGNIPVEECLAIIKNLSLKPFEGGYKMLLIWFPEFLGNSGNMLLKTIEEPPQKTIILLVTHQPDQVLGTILSRTQLVRVPPIEEAPLTRALVERHQLGEDEAQRIAFMSQGDYLRALELMSNEENEYLEPLRTWLGLCYKKNLPEAVKWGDAYSAKGREQIKGFLTYTLEIIRSILVYGHLKERAGLSGPEQAFVSNFSSILNTSTKIEQLYNWVNGAIYEVERNGQAKIIFADLSFKIAKLLKS